MNMLKRILSTLALALAVTSVSAQEDVWKTHCGTPTGQDKFPIYSYMELPAFEKSDPAQWKGVKGITAFWGDKDFRYPATYSPAGLKSVPVAKVLKGWRGERVFAQAVISSAVEAKDVEYVISDLKGSAAVIPASCIEAGFLRYVMTDEIGPTGNGCNARPDHSAYDSSMVADCVDPYLKSMDMGAMQTQGLWLTCWIPQDVPAGTYRGTVTIKSAGKTVKTLKLDVVAQKEVLPLPKDWSFHLDLWQNPFAVARYYQVPVWSKDHLEAMRPIMERLAKAGQKVITTSITHHPWHSQTEDPFESMITWTKKVDGTWEYGFDVFDMWVEFMMSCGIDQQINCYSMAPWKLSFLYLDQATYSLKEISTAPGEATYELLWTDFLKAFAKHLREKGWLGKTAIAMDERPMDVMKQIISVIKKADPGFKIALAGNYYEEIDKDVDDYCIVVPDKFPEGVVDRRRSEGKFSTYYTCCQPGKPNTFTCSDPAESREIGLLVANLNADGYLRWAYNSWPLEPLLDSRFRSWAAGDTYLVYPGNRTSIRFEHLIEGIQEYEKLKALK